MAKKGRNTIRDSKRDHRIEIRVTKEELEFIDRFSRERKLNRNNLLIQSVYMYALKSSFSIPVDIIKKFAL